MKTFLAVFLFLGFFNYNAYAATSVTTDHLKKAVSELATEWNDNNISNGGRTVIYVSKSDLSDSAASVAESLMRKTYKEYEEANLPKDATLKVKTQVLESRISGKTAEKMPALREVTKSLSNSNAYAKYDKGMEEQLVNVVRMLESERSHGQGPSLVARPAALEYTSVKTKLQDDVSSSEKKYELYVFRNVETGKMIVVYTVEGSM